jgi:serine/threonine-protein kinase RsbW
VTGMNGGERPRADVELRVPADGAYVSVLRSTAAGIASRLDFTLEGIEDLRIAVGEACAMVLPEADEGTTLTGEFFLSPDRLTLTVAVTGSEIDAPDYDSFAWQVLDTLAGAASAEVFDGRFAVTLAMGMDPVDA